ncbi:MAG: hypothetical protein COU69_03175 [Candidatus Pacebacteria bacterium CG10_big_fil_rev_8_21_14_0_10_56_10]|nr:MAG: hypothetical protein COU69_03175 [Candidatus Pacebacteria bacterium CG10_big_fil_rev_8_21_14_0_10_56_10]
MLILLTAVGVFSHLTNPFARPNIVQTAVQVEFGDGQFLVHNSSQPTVHQGWLFRVLATVKAAWNIVSGRVIGGPKAQLGTVDEVIAQIHRLRFDPDQPFLISGDHFSSLYPRNLGIFYNATVDPRTALDRQDWHNRQLMYLKSLGYALQVFDQADQLSTTIIPIGRSSVVLANYYAYPSDSLYGMLYAADKLLQPDELEEIYPFQADQPAVPQTAAATARLLEAHRPALRRHFREYWQTVYDPGTGLVRTDKLLSGAKDIAKRQGAFYDNVVAWKTHQLAQRLDLTGPDQEFLDEYRQRILARYWLTAAGHFAEDASQQALTERWYSSDWLVAYLTGLLDPEQPQDLRMLTSTVEYIRRNAIDQPFGLQYHPDQRRGRVYLPVLIGSPAYASTAIWSNWGMEYIKLLARLAQVTGDESYLAAAEKQLASYAFNIKRHRGYPEVYSAEGEFYRTPLYKSIRQTGWVVSFLQAREMVGWTREAWPGDFGRDVGAEPAVSAGG